MSTTAIPYRNAYVRFVDQYSEYAFVVLRIGLGTVVSLAGIHKFISPEVWTQYFAPWFTAIWPTTLISLDLLVFLEGAFEIVIGLALLVGWYTTIVTGVWTLVMATIIIDLATSAAMTGEFVDILIRDIGLFALALGLTLLSAERVDE